MWNLIIGIISQAPIFTAGAATMLNISFTAHHIPLPPGSGFYIAAAAYNFTDRRSEGEKLLYFL